MKKVLLAIAIAAAAGTASAADLTVNYNRDTTHGTNGGGLALSSSVQKVTVSASVDRYKKGTDIDAYGLTAGYEMFKLGSLGVSGLLGVNYLDVERGRSGFAGTVGLGVAYPITKTVAIVAEANRIMPENKIKAQEATIVSMGIRTSF